MGPLPGQPHEPVGPPHRRTVAASLGTPKGAGTASRGRRRPDRVNLDTPAHFHPTPPILADLVGRLRRHYLGPTHVRVLPRHNLAPETTAGPFAPIPVRADRSRFWLSPIFLHVGTW